MDKRPVYPGAIPLDLDWLQPQRNAEIALGFLMQAAFGTNTLFDGLAVTQQSVPNMTVQVGPGAIIFATTVDTLTSGFGSLPVDNADALVKIGINIGSTNMSALTAPATSGQSQNWLLEAQFLEVDSGAIVLPYYNATNPSVPYTGPANAGTPNNTARTNTVSLQWKGGTAATTGTQNTPSPDSGWVGVAVVTVANGQTTITNSNIAPYGGSPMVPTKLGAQRTRLFGALNLYVSATGSDSAGSGLAASSPFSTLQHAYNVIASNYDVNGQTVTINVGNGTYTVGINAVGVILGVSTSNPIQVIGNTGSPSSVIIANTVSNAACFVAADGAALAISGLTMTSNPAGGFGSGGGYAINAGFHGFVSYSNVVFGVATACHITTGTGGYAAGLNYSISGGAPAHVVTGSSASLISIGGTITLTGTPAFGTAFAVADAGSLIYAPGVTFSGSATGARYTCTNGGYIDTNGGGSSYLPGNSSGTNTSGYYV